MSNKSKKILILFEMASALFWFKSLPKDKILDRSKLKSLTDNNMDMAKTMISVFGDQHFLLFPQSFQKSYSSGSFKVGIIC